jgi:hypothetical protein
MIESPLIQEIVAENTQKTLRWAITAFLELRFGPVPAVSAALNSVMDEQPLRVLLRFAVSCPDLAAFQARLVSS